MNKKSEPTKYEMSRVDKTKVAIYKKGKEPSDVSYWLSQPAVKRIQNLEEICKEYNQWKYGAEQRLQRVYRIVKRKTS